MTTSTTTTSKCPFTKANAMKWVTFIITLLHIPTGVYFITKGWMTHNEWMSTAGMYQVLMSVYMYLYLSSV